MKKYIVFIAVSSLLFCSSCTSFLEETNPNKIPASTFYQTEDDIAMAANGAYAALRGNGYYKTQLYTLMYQTKYLILYYQLQGKIKPTYLRNRSVLK